MSAPGNPMPPGGGMPPQMIALAVQLLQIELARGKLLMQAAQMLQAGGAPAPGPSAPPAPPPPPPSGPVPANGPPRGNVALSGMRPTQ